jgi:hypothetical protein
LSPRIVEIDTVVVGRQTARVADRNLRVEQIRAHPLVGPVDPVGVVHVGVRQSGVRDRLLIDTHGVEGLMVLAPAHRAYIALVAEIDLLAAYQELGFRQAVVGGVDLVDLGARRVGDTRSVQYPVPRVAGPQVVVLVTETQVAHVLELEEESEPVEAGRAVERRRAQGRCATVLFEQVVGNVFVTVP